MVFLTKIRPSGSHVRLGEGISGTVDLVEKRGLCYVVKTYHSRERHESRKEYQQRVLHEFLVLKELDHPNIIKVLKYHVSFDGITVKMYMEAGYHDLRTLVKAVPAKDVSSDECFCLWKQLCSGVSYLHSRNICHRDLKLQNLVLDKRTGNLKIIDFATAFHCGATQAVGIVGSAQYMAPETANSISYDGKKVDMWSLAIILYFLLNRKFPWKIAQWGDVDFAAFATRLKSDKPTQVSENETGADVILRQLPGECVGLISELLVVDPNERLSIGDVNKDAWYQLIKSCTEAKYCGSQHRLSEHRTHRHSSDTRP